MDLFRSFALVTAGLLLSLVEYQCAVRTGERSTPFHNIRWKRTFVDKTLFIKEFIKSDDHCLYLKAPPRFGKTVNLDMLRLFLEDPTTERSSISDISATEKYNLFRDTKIGRLNNGKFFDRHFRNYKVIYLNFRHLRDVVDYPSFEKSLCLVICETMAKHAYLQNLTSDFKWADKASSAEKCLAYCLEDFDTRSKYSVQKLSKKLYEVFKKPVLVLGDDFDAIVHSLWKRNVSEATSILLNLEIFLGPIVKRNEYVKASIFFGSLSSGWSPPTFADNIVNINFHEREAIGKFFGFTLEEIEHILSNFSLLNELEDVQYLYNGYDVRGGTNNPVVYNPYSITEFAENGELEYYWAKQVPGPRNHFNDFFSHPQIGNVVERILFGKDKYPSIKNEMSYTKINRLKECVELEENKKPLKDADVEFFIQYLTENGYLTLDYSTSYKTRIYFSVLKVANRETRWLLENKLMQSKYFGNVFNLTEAKERYLIDAVVKLSKREESFKVLAEAIYGLLKDKCQSIRSRRVTVVGPIHYVLKKQPSANSFILVEAELKIKHSLPIGNFSTIDLLIIRKDRTGILVEVSRKLEQDSKTALNKILKYQYYNALHWDRFKKWNLKHTILIGINIDAECRCNISCLFDSTTQLDATHV